MSTVVDASVVVDALVVTAPAGDLARAELRGLAELQVPAIFSAEVTSALRRLVLLGTLSAVRASTALSSVMTMRAIQYPFEPFARRAWELRNTITVYDAWYVALAEQLGAELVTLDKRLADAQGPRCPIRCLGIEGRAPGRMLP